MAFILNYSNAQTVCDSTYMTCDSVFIDSVFLSGFGNSQWLAFDVTVNHNFLYAPALVICPTIDSILFDDENMEFTSIVGPLTFPVHYAFQDFNFPDEYELSGNIVVDNSINNFSSCRVPFSIIIDEPTGINQSPLEDTIEIYPNPVHDKLLIELPYENIEHIDIQLFNLAGAEQSISIFENEIDLSGIPPGLYTISFELNNERIIKQVIKK